MREMKCQSKMKGEEARDANTCTDKQGRHSTASAPVEGNVAPLAPIQAIGVWEIWESAWSEQ